jgi:hypothetical protein
MVEGVRDEMSTLRIFNIKDEPSVDEPSVDEPSVHTLVRLPTHFQKAG